jgi:CSLREA domain-containing protein
MKYNHATLNNLFKPAKKILMFSIFTALLILAVTSANAATFTVTKVADTNDGVCDTDCSLREAIASANTAASNDTIEFSQPLFTTAQIITLGSTLELIGGGTTVNGTGSNLLTITITGNRAFNITGNNTTVGNIRINGGGIEIGNTGLLNLSNSTIENANGGMGGAIYNNRGTLSLNNSNLVNNRGGIGGGICNFFGVITVTNSTINNNTGSDFLGGGGIYNESNGVINVINSTINNNRAPNPVGGGGGVTNFGTFNLTDSTVSGNLAQTDGGGIFNQTTDALAGSGVLTITGSTISDNISNTGIGGGIFNKGLTLTINRSTINNNLAFTKSGGGIALQNFLGDSSGILSITNSTINNNSAALDGGGIFKNNLPVLSMINTTIVFNAADFDNNSSGTGGGIYANSGGINIRNTIIANNTAQSGQSGQDISGSLSSQGFNLIKNTSGGSVFGITTGNIFGQDPKLLPFSNYGGLTKTFGLQFSSPAIDTADPGNFPATDQRGIIRPQDGDGNGSMIPDIGAVESQLNTLTVTKVADTNDGTCDTDCSLREAIFTVNNGTNGLIKFDTTVFATPRTIALTQGELVVANSGTLIINGTGRNLLTVSGNNQSRIFMINSTTSAMINGLTISNGNGAGNVNTGFGGGILNKGGILTLNDVSLRNNSATGNGGGIFNDTGTLTITNASIGNNNSNSGGGISNSGTLTLTKVTVNSNTAVLGGGGIGNSLTMTMTNCTVSGNSTAGPFGGGGIFNNSLSTANITYSTIVSNVANFGDGIRNNDGTVNARSTIIADNTDNSGSPSDFFGTLTSQGFNLVESVTGTTITGNTNGNILGQDPNLGPLADNGGLTLTHLLLAGSPGIDRGDSSSFPATDQREISRPRDGDANGTSIPDIGAVEIISPPLLPLTLSVDRVDDAVVSNCTAAPNDCTFRGAITKANSILSDDTINFDSVIFASARTIILGGTNLQISNAGSLTINGTDAGLLTISGNNTSRVFLINIGANAKIPNLTVTQGNGSSGNGGGISNSGILELDKVTVSNNMTTADAGGGIANLGTLTVTNSTVSNNTTTVGAGGIYNFGTNTTLINSTVSGNTAPLDGGIGNFSPLVLVNVTVSDNKMTGTDPNFSGGVNTSATANVRNTIIAGNTSGGLSLDVRGTFTSMGYNLIGNTTGSTGFSTANNDILNPSGGAMLGSLSFNGGSTRTHPLLAGSPAVDNGKSFGSITDQRGYLRPFDNPLIPNAPGGDGADIGSFEKDALPRRTPFDFDGDGKTDISIFRPNVGQWWYSRSSDSATRVFTFGTSTDKLVPADYTGDGKTDIATFTPSTGFWNILRSEDSTYYAYPFGSNGDIAVPADYDGDGKADSAVFRPSSSTWFISKSSGGTTITPFGTTGDVPAVGDYDGDGKTDIAIYRVSAGQWWYLRSSDNTNRVFTFGTSTDKIVQGDYTGDGKTDIAFYRPSTGFWFILRSEDSSFYAFPFGTSGDIPVAGDYDGDGKFDAGVFRPSNNTWYLNRSTAGVQFVGFGTTGDLPVPNAFVP